LDYVPPEIVVGEYYYEKVDIWCIGILCYELCTGHAPFEAKNNELETYDKILSVDLAFPSGLS
jgi:serine/threonine protein kinase